MPSEILDRATVKKLALPPGKRAIIYWDRVLPRFGLLIRLDTKEILRRSYLVQYRVKGTKQGRKTKLGDFELMTVDAARKAAVEILEKVTAGSDPVAEEQAKEQALTFEVAVDQYLKFKSKKLRPSSFRLAKLYLTGDKYFPGFRKKLLGSVNRTEIVARLTFIDGNSGPDTASRCQAWLSAFYTWCLESGLCEKNPVLETRTFEGGEARDRVLDESEIRAVWNATGGNDDFHKIVRLLLLTGCRASEIGGLRWSELDMEAGVLTLPKERVKNKHEHKLTLPPLAMDILRSVPKRVGRDCLFGERTDAGFTAWQYKDSLGDGIEKEWRLHDLRRSVATHMCEIGIAPHIAEAVLNHVSGHKGGIAGIYNRAEYKPQVTHALAKWAERIKSIVDGTPNNNVVPISSAA